MKRFDRNQTLDDRQLRSLARSDQRRAELRRNVAPRRVEGRPIGQYEFGGLLELEERSTTSDGPVGDYFFANRSSPWVPRYWRRVTARWRSRVAGADRRQYL